VAAVKTGTIRQVAWIPAPPMKVYETLMTTKGHTGFTGAKSKISGRVGGSFMAWDGYIHGTNLELEPGKKIVQSWVPAEENWPAGYETKVVYTLRPARGGTRIHFTHSGVPIEHVGHLSEGWRTHYWGMLTVYLGPEGKGR
jgi:uncharacterized protein YndB with AHSA1/START domain